MNFELMMFIAIAKAMGIAAALSITICACQAIYEMFIKE